MWTLSRSTTWTSAGPLPFDKCYVVQWQQLQFCQTCSPWLTLGKSQKSKLCTDWLDTTCERLGSWPQIGLILPQIQSNWPLSWLAIFGWADGPVAEGRYFHHQWQILALCPGSSEVISFSSVFWFTLIKWWLLSIQTVQRCAAHIPWIEIVTILDWDWNWYSAKFRKNVLVKLTKKKCSVFYWFSFIGMERIK